MRLCSMSHTSVVALVVALVAVLVPSAQATPSSEGQASLVREHHLQVARSLQAQALDDHLAYAALSELTTRFGARPAGSVQANAATHWVRDLLGSAGLRDVHLEPVAIRQTHYTEATLRVIGEHRQSLVVVPLQGSPATAGMVTGEVVVFPTYRQFLDAPVERIRGHIVLVTEAVRRTRDGSGYVAAIRMREEGPDQAASRGARAYLVRSVGTHVNRLANNGSTIWHVGSGIPSLALSPVDALQLERLAALGPLSVQLSVTVDTRAATAYNIIGDIPGRESKLPPILVAAHLDSWEQGTGAIDDGFGVAVVSGAMRLIAGLGEPPGRTIRIVLFGAEEISQPLPIGNFPAARAYVAQHCESGCQLAAASESDWGGGRILSLTPPAKTPVVQRQLLARVLAPLHVSISDSEPTSGGPDVNILKANGAPVFRLKQDATSFFDVHHNANDTFERVDPDNLQQNMAAWASVAWILANE